MSDKYINVKSAVDSLEDTIGSYKATVNNLYADVTMSLHTNMIVTLPVKDISAQLDPFMSKYYSMCFDIIKRRVPSLGVGFLAVAAAKHPSLETTYVNNYFAIYRDKSLPPANYNLKLESVARLAVACTDNPSKAKDYKTEYVNIANKMSHILYQNDYNMDAYLAIAIVDDPSHSESDYINKFQKLLKGNETIGMRSQGTIMPYGLLSALVLAYVTVASIRNPADASYYLGTAKSQCGRVINRIPLVIAAIDNPKVAWAYYDGLCEYAEQYSNNYAISYHLTTAIVAAVDSCKDELLNS